MKKTKWFLCCLVVMTSTAYAQEVLTLPPVSLPVAEQISILSLQDIQTLEERGKYLDAQIAYEQILKNETLQPEKRSKIQESYESLNLKYLFSRFEMPESETYVVVAGDSLYNIAKKYDTTVELIKRSNSLSKDTIYPGMKLKVITGKFSIRVDKSDNMLWLYLNGKMIKRYRVATGRNNGTPIGEFTIVNKLPNPTWFNAGAVVPPESADNILGTRWMGFDYAGYGIHGTTIPESIGSQATAGCIRMRNEEVEELYAMIPAETKVLITD